jgi:hypothetical protein
MRQNKRFFGTFVSGRDPLEGAAVSAHKREELVARLQLGFEDAKHG